MSTTGVCPYCGKTFKRLSRHLSHCKARPEPPQAHQDLAGSKETLSTRRDLTGSKETLSTRRDLTGSKETLSTRRDLTASKETLSTPPPSSRLTSSSSEKATKSKTPSKESPVKSPLTTKKERREKASRPSSVPLSESLPPSTPLKSESESFSSASLMPSPLGSSPESMSRPVSSKKKTQRRQEALLAPETKLEHASKSNLAGRRLGQVRLGELPVWLAIKTPSRPREAVEAVQRGWQWYYRKYINVKRGGVGGVSMLLAGYCVLSYVWQYPNIKCDRWRKYH
ncbi:unnamed protein product [Merluccius merluccius]